MFRRAPIEQITPGTASDRFFTGHLVLVDVRGDREYAIARVPGALHIPLTQLAGRLSEIRTDKPVAFLCRSGRRSAVAVRRACKRRHDVLNVIGGMTAWIAADLPLARCAPPSTIHSTTSIDTSAR
jgi:rhodanese-related sulfurtransferase